MGMTKETRQRLREYYETYRPKDTVDPRQIYAEVRRELGKRSWESSSEEGQEKERKNQVRENMFFFFSFLGRAAASSSEERAEMKNQVTRQTKTRHLQESKARPNTKQHVYYISHYTEDF